MEKTEGQEIIEKIKEAMIYSAKKLVEDKKRLGQKLVISEKGVIKVIDPNSL